MQQAGRRDLLDERTLEEIAASGGKVTEGFADAERGIVESSVARHLLEEVVGKFVAERAMLDGVGVGGERVGNIAGVPSVNGERELIGVGLGGDGVEERSIEAIEDDE